MHIACIGNFFPAWHKYAFARLSITYDQYNFDKTTCFTKEICDEINSKQYDFVLITNAWGRVTHPYSDIKHKTVFWTSEDPNHFNALIGYALQCDYVFTGASECINKYIFSVANKYNVRLRQENVHMLQFGMVPELHYRNELQVRSFDIVFIGNRYPSCKVRVDGENAVIHPIIRNTQYDVHIYGHWEGNHGWENVIAPYLHHGWVACDRVVDVYNKARIAISLNEQIDSPTMCSMRVFDIIGCAIPMLSYRSAATKNLFNDYVNFVTNPKETIDFVNNFLYNERYRAKCIEKAKEGREYALQNHTYTHRFQEMLGILGYDIK